MFLVRSYCVDRCKLRFETEFLLPQGIDLAIFRDFLVETVVSLAQHG